MNTLDIEREVIESFASKYGFDLDNLWGLVTMIGIDDPCSLFITTKETLDGQNPFDAAYLNVSMPMIDCSRSAVNPLKFCWIMKTTRITCGLRCFHTLGYN